MKAVERNADTEAVVLCADMDGTLIKTDMMFESLCALARQHPLMLFLAPFWLLRGRAYFKHRLGLLVSVNPAHLPYHQQFLDFLRKQHSEGRRIVLATASDLKLAQPVADYLGIFEDVIASNGMDNMRGSQKCRELVRRYGEFNFDYAGNAALDDQIWCKSRTVLVVGAPSRLVRRMQSKYRSIQVFAPLRFRIATLFRAMRVHQWAKNLLIFIPLLLAHRVLEPALLVRAVLAFVSFSLCASSVYLLNDLLDLEADREHHSKRQRPLAAGDLSIVAGAVLVPVLLMFAVGVGLLLSIEFLLVLLLYFGITLGYSFQLKQVAVLDIITLAALYTIRVTAGAVAVQVAVSQWLLAFSMFVFLSLACIKRFSELRLLRLSNKQESKGRGYVADDLEQIASFGSAGGYISVLVLALYIQSSDVVRLYSQPQLLWVLCPLVLYWISRVWLLAHRGALLEDPLIFALHDKVSYLVVAVGVVILYLAT